jgi:hypothetical protein
MYHEFQKLFVKTATMYYTGEFVRETDDCIVVKKAAWIALTGSFAQNIKSCDFQEVEPFPDDVEVRIRKGGIICDFDIEKLPRDRC